MTTDEIPQWALSKDEQKHVLERYIGLLLDSGELTDHRRFFLAEAIGYTMRGLFGLARAAVTNAYDDAEKFEYYEMDADIIAEATPWNLSKTLCYLKGSPAREHPIFR